MESQRAVLQAILGGIAVTTGRILLLVFGVIILLVGIASLFGGGALIWANSALTDDEGFLTTSTVQLDQDSHAIVTTPTDVDVSTAWLWTWSNLVIFKVEGSKDDPSKQIFIGIAEESFLNTYLSNVNYDEITEFRFYPYSVEYTNHPGDSEPAAPTSQTFWAASAYGGGNQTLKWEPETGSYSLVLMNDDGSAGVDLSVVFGAKLPWVFGIGVGLLVAGVLSLVTGGLMVTFAFVARRSKASPPT